MVNSQWRRKKLYKNVTLRVGLFEIWNRFIEISDQKIKMLSLGSATIVQNTFPNNIFETGAVKSSDSSTIVVS